MKIFIQPTQDTPEDFIQADSKDWDSFVRIRPFAVSVQGVTFSADWYCVVDKDYGCDVITLDNDSRWYPNPIANVWQFWHIAPDSNGAWDTRQTRIIYADNYAELVPANTVLKSFGEFTAPANMFEGLLISDDLLDAHIAIQNIKGWREWTENVPEEEIVDGKIRDQTELGRYIKATGTRTYVQRSTAQLNDIHVVRDAQELSLNTASAALATSSSLGTAGGQDVLAFVFTNDQSNEPDSAAWPTGDYRIQLDVSAAGADILFGILTLGASAGHFARIDSAITSDLETKTQIESAGAGTGTVLFTTGSVSWSSGTATDKFECVLAQRNTAAHGANANMTLDLNVGRSFADGPWTAAAGAGGASILMPRLQTKKFRHILTR